MAQNGHSSDFKIGWEKGWEAGWRAAIEFGRSSSAISLGLPPQSALGLPQLAPPAGPPPPGLKQDSPRDWSSIKCTLCKQFHKEARHACSKIKDILTGRFSVPSDICLKCLSLLNSDGRCSNTRQPCHVVRTARGETVSLICSSHSPPTHFQICRSCAPDLPRSLSKQKTTPLPHHFPRSPHLLPPLPSPHSSFTDR